MDLATITLPPYLYNPQDAILTLIDNRRFTMRDIGDIEDRVNKFGRSNYFIFLEVVLRHYKYKMKKVEIDLKLDFL